MQVFFAFTLLVSATLLFLVQPMFAKMVLPLLGGTPAVWNTCMVFYQAVLLAGYLYAHFSTKLLGTRRQAGLHLVLLLLPWIVLPIGVAQGWTPPGDANPIPWLLVLLTLSVGLPFFVVSASAPMLQAWFADTGHPAGKDPYFLYAASNLGSMLALLGYPVVVEKYLPLAQQSWVWAIGYGSLMLLTLGCAMFLWRSRGVVSASAAPTAEVRAGSQPMTVAEMERALAGDEANGVPTWALRLRWLGLSFAPSSLLLGVTTYITTDIASFALLWVIPLALYLLTFVLVFAQWPTAIHRFVARRLPNHPTLAKVFDPHWLFVWVQPILVAMLALVIYNRASSDDMGWMILLHLTAFFVTAMVCHGELARSRPAASHLTEFYIWMSLGGVLGGMFNALIAPVVFPTVVEYPIALALACMLRPTIRLGVPGFVRRLGKGLETVPWSVVSRWLDLALPLVVFGIMHFLYKHPDMWTKVLPTLNRGVSWLNPRVGGILPGLTSESAVLGLGILLSFAFLFRPVRFGMSVGAVLLAGYLWYSGASDVMYTDRSFYGVMRIKEGEPRFLDDDPEQPLHYKRTLLHGSTNHGEQWTDPEWRYKPITYYFPSGPIGEVFTKLIDPVMHKQIGIAGLGTGTTAAYGKPGQTITYFEIDPHVVKIATDSRYFTYVNDTPATVDIKLGDARLSLEQKIPDGYFDLLLIDAFSSDAIPVHMITKEAIELYFRKLKKDGILIVHISNLHLNLRPVVGNIAQALGLEARYCDDFSISEEESAEGKFNSDAVVVTRKAENGRRPRLGSLMDDPHWQPITWNDKVGVWTDDYSNVLSVVRWLHPEMDD